MLRDGDSGETSREVVEVAAALEATPASLAAVSYPQRANMDLSSNV